MDFRKRIKTLPRANLYTEEGYYIWCGTMFRFMDEHGLKPYGGCAEQPMSVPPGLRTGDYHFTVVFFMPVILGL